VRARPADVIDVFVYVVVLNLALEYVPSVISEGFTLSLLTALLLKIALEVALALKGRVVHRSRIAATPRAKVTAALSLWGGRGREQAGRARTGRPRLRLRG
jgi:hypothetical protein